MVRMTAPRIISLSPYVRVDDVLRRMSRVYKVREFADLAGR